MKLPKGKFGAIMADPAIPFTTWSRKGEGRTPQHHYRCEAFDKLAAVPVASVAKSGLAQLFKPSHLKLSGCNPRLETEFNFDLSFCGRWYWWYRGLEAKQGGTNRASQKLAAPHRHLVPPVPSWIKC
jgi:hypothetical protein